MVERGPRAVGLDVGGTSLKSGLVGGGGEVLGEVRETPLPTQGPAEPLLETLAEVLRGHLQEVGRAGCAGVGVGFPGPFDYPRGVCLVQGVGGKFESLYGMDLGAELRRRADLGDLPLRFRNDAQAAVVGEARWGAGAGATRLLGVTLGTGLGAAFLAEGEPVKGRDGVPEDGELYHQDAGGAIADEVFSKRGLEARLEAAGWEGEVARAAQREDLAEVFEAWGRDLGRFLRPYLEAFRAERLLVLGGISGALGRFGPALAEELPCEVAGPARGREGALLGAAALVLEQAAPGG